MKLTLVPDLFDAQLIYSFGFLFAFYIFDDPRIYGGVGEPMQKFLNSMSTTLHFGNMGMLRVWNWGEIV